jgi:hypothetical protein
MENDDFDGGQRGRSGVPLAPAGERTLRIDSVPPRDEGKTVIHQRKPLPLVPRCEEGDETAEPTAP